MIFMGLLDNIKGLFKRESVNSNIGTKQKKLTNRISLKSSKNRINYPLGKKILEDTQVSTGFDILKYILSSKQWVLVANENDTDGTVYDFISNMLFNMDTEVQEIVKQTITAIPWGFSVHELLFDINSEGKLYLKNTVPLHIKTLQDDPFIYDDDGELIGVHQEYNGNSVDIPINKVLKYSFNANFDEDYGNGLLYDFKPIVEDKLNINNWLMTFLEKHESPTLYGKTSDPTSRDALLDAFEDVSEGTTGLVVGAEDDLGVLESGHRGETFFKTLQYKDNQIFRRYYLGNLLMGDNSQTGTYAQSQTQLDFGMLIFDGILEEIANCIQKQIINPIVKWNFENIDLAPTLSFDKFTTGDLTKLFGTLKPLIDSGVVDSENKAVQDSIALMFKKETGLHYINEEPEMPEENFNYQEPVNGEELTGNILNDLDAVTEQTD
jgi:phage gp29-like protein